MYFSSVQINNKPFPETKKREIMISTYYDENDNIHLPLEQIYVCPALRSFV